MISVDIFVLRVILYFLSHGALALKYILDDKAVVIYIFKF